jgi:hypothetical protein
LKVLEQTSDTQVKIGDVTVSTEDFEHHVFSQFKPYKIQLQSFERYINYDGGKTIDAGGLKRLSCYRCFTN